MEEMEEIKCALCEKVLTQKEIEDNFCCGEYFCDKCIDVHIDYMVNENEYYEDENEE